MVTKDGAANHGKALYFKAIRFFPQIRLIHNLHKQMPPQE
jgi:hypothetical protein